MTFLAPGSALLAAAITLPLLLALYFLKLRRRPVRVSTIMFWPVAAQDVQVNVPLRVIRPSWLLLLHVLILLALLGAIARPAAAGAVASRGRIVLLIDRSASISARDTPDGPSRLDRAKERARALVRDAARGSARIAVVQFAADAAPLTGLAGSRSLLDAAIDSITPTDQPGDLRKALRLADSIVGAAAEEGGEEPATAVLISDGGFPPDDSLSSGGVRLRFERVGPGPDAMPNAGIAAISARRDYADPATVRLFAEFISTSPRDTTLAVTLALDGRPAASRVVKLPAGDAAGPGRAGETFEFSSAGPAVASLALPGGDALAADDFAAVVLPETRRPAIVLVRPDGEENAGAWLLEEVLRELKPRALRVVTASEYRALGRAADLLVFAGVTPAPMPGVPTLHFGGAPETAGLTIQAPTPGAASTSRSPLIWKRDHPVLREVVLDSVVAANVSRLAIAEGAQRLTDLARGADGPMIVLDDGPPRRLVVAFDLEDSNWPLLVGFPIFMANAVDYLTMQGDSAAGRAFAAGQEVAVRVRGPGPVTLEGPGTIPLHVEGEVASGAPVERAGVYTVKGDSALDTAVAVNLVNAIESSLVSPADLKVGSATLSSRAGLAAPRELWPYALMIAAGLLVVEWVLYAWRARV